jgi:hypothetical protein
VFGVIGWVVGYKNREPVGLAIAGTIVCAVALVIGGCVLLVFYAQLADIFRHNRY